MLMPIVANNVEYRGPHAEIASLTGSPFWNLTVQGVLDAYGRLGWEVIWSGRPETPYGKGPLTYVFRLPSGRNVLWIPSYGMENNRDWPLRQTTEKVYWIFWKAGVKVCLIGGTSGITDWRTDESRILPGDLVLPWSFWTRVFHRGLPGTEYEAPWATHDLLMTEPFCPDLRGAISDAWQPHIEKGTIRRIHTPETTRVAIVEPITITYETDFDILVWRAITQVISQMEAPGVPVVTIHGDCIGPYIARFLGIHLAYYHLVANFAQGQGVEITDTVYHLHTEVFPNAALDVESRLLATIGIPSGQNCYCVRGLHRAPSTFGLSMTQGDTQ